MNKYLKLILEEGRRLAKDYDYLTGENLHAPKCAACLAADARSNIDNKLGEKSPCFEEGDPYMLQAKRILAKELNWELEGEEPKKIISKNIFEEDKHEHIDDIQCPRCGIGLKPIFKKRAVVGCMEYDIFLCDHTATILEQINEKKSGCPCDLLIIHYPYNSAEKKNKIIELT